MSKSSIPLLLDTHVWIWLVSGSAELPAAAVRSIDRAAADCGVFISAISLWETATLFRKGRIALRPSLPLWVQGALALPGMELAPLSPEVAVETAAMPAEFPGDPADRMIMATARIGGMTLVTRDRNILSAAAGYIDVLAA